MQTEKTYNDVCNAKNKTRGNDTFINVRIADDVNALPIGSRITKATVAQYIDIHQTFISHTTESKQRKTYLLKLAENLQDHEKGVVYNGNGIAIVSIDVGH